MKIGPGVSELWGVENRPLPLTRPMAYTTACTTVQAVITLLTLTLPSTKYLPFKLDSCPNQIFILSGYGLRTTVEFGPYNG